MTTMRLLNKVAPLAITLLVFIFGTQFAIGQTTYTWKGTTSADWGTSSNWDPAGVPGSSDYVVFDATGTTTSEVPSGGADVAKVTASVPHTITLTGNLDTDDLVIDNSVTLLLNTPGYITVNSSAAFGTGAILDGVRQVTLNLNGTMSMADLSAYVGSKIFTELGEANFMLSDVVFMGTLDINGLNVPLGTNDLYMGPNPGGQITGYNTDAGDQNANGAIVTLNESYTSATTVVGRLCKGFGPGSTGLNSYFTYPLSSAGASKPAVTQLVLGIKTSCATPVFSSVLPFPNIAARIVYTPGGASGGHPGAEPSTPTVLFHWPIVGNGIADSATIAGYVAFHNHYRNNGTDLFSAIYKPHLEQQTPPTNNPLIEGAWDLNGSQPTPTTGGNFRWVPFGPYDGLEYGSTTVYSSYSGGCMTGFGDISVGTNSGGQIPVELTSFSARHMDGSVRLNWQTATELNNNGFFIERSIDGDGYIWEEIDFVAGAGNSNVPLDYRYEDVLDTDLQRLQKIAYRLRQVDRDGTTDYSSIVYAYSDVRPMTVEMYEAYPNPFNPSTTLSFNLQETVHVTLRVFNTFGQEVATVVNNTMDAGYHTVEFRGSELPSGMYVAVLDAAGTVQQQKLVLNK